MTLLTKAFFTAALSAALFLAPSTNAFAPHSTNTGFVVTNSHFKPVASPGVSLRPEHISLLTGAGAAFTSLYATGLEGTNNPIFGAEQLNAEVRRLAPTKDFDMEGAEKAILESYSNFAMVPISERIVDAESGVVQLEEVELEASFISDCDQACLELGIEAVGLIMTLIGVPGTITKKIGRKIINKAEKKLSKELRRIARDYFKDAGDFVSVGNGLAQLMSELLKVMNIDFIVNSIFGEMSWGEIISLGAFITAQVTIIFFSGGSALAIKLLLVAPAVVDLCVAAAKVNDEC